MSTENMKSNFPGDDHTCVASPPRLDSGKTISASAAGAQNARLGKMGAYEIVDFIGFGGSGMVYRAIDANGAELALKIMTVNPFMSKLDIRRFLSEAETSKKLRKHPNIITVYDTGQEGNDFYIAMELVKGGRCFKDLIESGVSIEKALDLLIPVADALAYAHSEGILHRDIKPANILLNDFGQPLLADFGLAKSETADRMTMTGSVMGTPRYMSPEQAGFGDGLVTKQSDIYSFGLVAYELIVGAMPYSLNGDMPLPEIFRVICSEEAIPPRKIKKEISRNLEAVLLRMLEKEKSLRYKEMAQVCADLKACRDGGPVSVRKLSWAEKFEKSIRRNIAIASTAVLFIILGVFLYFTLLRPLIMEKTYSKHDSDVSAVASMRKSATLEKELAIAKGADSQARELLDINANYKTAVNLLHNGRLDDSEKLLLEVAAYAEKNNMAEMLADCNANLARIRICQGKNMEALKLLDSALYFYGEGSIKGRLALFESGVALYFDGKYAEASEKWRRILSHAGLDSRCSGDYICLSAKIMLDEKDIEISEECPAAYKGIFSWSCAQKASNGEIRRGWLDEAHAHAGVFAWINKQGETR